MQWYASLQIPLVRHSGAFTDWLKFVHAVTYQFCLLLFHILFGCVIKHYAQTLLADSSFHFIKMPVLTLSFS